MIVTTGQKEALAAMMPRAKENHLASRKPYSASPTTGDDSERPKRSFGGDARAKRRVIHNINHLQAPYHG
jgi:hypothetical protein